jgi:alpha-L-rhamnosidase
MKNTHPFIINYLIVISRNYRRITAFIFFLFVVCFSEAQQATWIWYPGDYEIWLSNKMQNRRTEREMFYPPFWRVYSPYNLVHFYKKVDLSTADEISIFVDGEYNISLDGKSIYGHPEKLALATGKHIISLLVYNQSNVPSIFIRGKQVVSDGSWMVSFDQKDSFFRKKQTEESTAELPLAGSWNFNDPQITPSMFKLPTKPEAAESSEKTGSGVLVDFGKETFGFLQFHGLKGTGQVAIYYGESKEEALATGTCETSDHLKVNMSGKKDLALNDSKAFRYVYLVPDASVKFDSVSMLYEYLPLEERGRFRCSDEQINRIWNVAAYTLRLTSREFFIDGIKRDRWVWSGDAYQSYLMNYYLFFDSPLVKRTLVALRGKSPVSSHINTILDYSFYWFLGIYDYYQYTGDLEFVRTYYPRMVELMDFCLNRRDQNGMMVGLPGDWVYIDWADMSKNGELSFEQMLFTRSLETMALCAGLLDDQTAVAKYGNLAAELKSKLIPAFWSDEKHAFIHSRVDGKQSDVVTRYANMFAIFFEYLDNQKQQEVKQHVLLNDRVQKITTPYMRFYELEAMCAMGENNYVRKEIKDYWGGMLNQGATSFWEKYDPNQTGVEHYSMYGKPFGKSMCHAWGASPIYLLGKYFLGVKPVSPGYKKFFVEPKLGGLEWMEGSVPTPDGNIDVWCNLKEIKVKSSSDGTGTLRFKSLSKPVCKTAEIRQTGDQQYEMTVLKNQEYVVKYKNAEIK